VVVTFLLALLIGSEPCQYLTEPSYIPLPSSRLLWEAKSAWAWECEYDAQCADFVVHQPPVQTVRDFAIAKRGGNGTLTSGSSGRDDDALIKWHAGVDGLGMVVAVVLAGV
jgi:hypothetical protein